MYQSVNFIVMLQLVAFVTLTAAPPEDVDGKRKCCECEGSSLRHNLCQYSRFPGEAGIRVSTNVTEDQFKCLKKCGFKFVIIRAYLDDQDGGRVDENASSNIANARAAEFHDVGIYMSPAVGPSANTAGMQVEELVTELPPQTNNYNRIWISVEGIWNGNVQKHQNFFMELLNGIAAIPKPAGVCTNQTEWIRIMGATFFDGSHLPLKRVKYGKPADPKSIDSFTPFGGWNDWNLTEYRKNVNCDVEIYEIWRYTTTQN